MNNEIENKKLDFYNSDKYLLVDVFCGKPKISNININKIKNSQYELNHRMEVNIMSKSKKIDEETGEEYYAPVTQSAFIKCSTFEFKDDLDIILSEIANLLGIQSSKVYRLLTPNNIKGTININVKKKNEKLISIELLAKKTIEYIKKQNLPIPKWLKDYITLPESTKDSPLQSYEQIDIVLNFFIELINYNFDLTEKNQSSIIKNYIFMILFDYITEQNKRSLTTYSILINNESNTPELAPIYDYNNELRKASSCILNNKYVDKESLISYLFEKYYQYFKEVSRGLTENASAYLQSIKLIIDNNTDSNHADIIYKLINKNIEKIVELETEKSQMSMNSRIDLALTQTSINLNAVNKNQLIRNKYEKDNSNDKISLKPSSFDEAKEKNKKQKGSNIIIFFISLLLICLLGISLAMLLFHLND